MRLFGEDKDRGPESKLCDEYAKLIGFQLALEKEDGGRSSFVGLSVNETVRQCLIKNMAKKADKLRSDFKVPDKRFWSIKVSSLVATRDIEGLWRLLRRKRAPLAPHHPFEPPWQGDGAHGQEHHGPPCSAQRPGREAPVREADALVKGNIGFVFTSGDLKDIREAILANRVAAPARAGGYAPADVIVKAGNTGMEPGKTSFFQALGVPTKIARGTIEIVSDVKVVAGGTRVGSSEAMLLNMLNISPFTYGMSVTQIYDNGQTFGSEVLDISEDVLVDRFLLGIKQVASISLALNYPTIASVTHSLVNGYKNLIAVSLATEYEFEGSAKAKAYLADPSAFAAAAPAAAAAATEDAPAAAAEEKEEEKEESDDDMGFGLFD
ncbi:hypothetical protein L7F22_027027 [Adiantum nelumboides]|nr:hypothetical protein [Adiantum nelumboides]